MPWPLFPVTTKPSGNIFYWAANSSEFSAQSQQGNKNEFQIESYEPKSSADLLSHQELPHLRQSQDHQPS